MSKKKGRKKANILVVDDEQSMRDSMHMLLRDNYNVFMAKSGNEAFDVVKNNNVDLVLLDIRLPEIDGIEVLKLIKGHDDSIEVTTSPEAFRDVVTAMEAAGLQP